MKKLFIPLFVLLIAYLSKRLLDSGLLYQPTNFNKFGYCEKIEGVKGAEDITIDIDSGLAYISAVDRRIFLKKGFDAVPQDAGVYTLDVNQFPSIIEGPLGLIDYDGVFQHVHGLSLYKTADGNKYLFLINHVFNSTTVADFVEIFKIQGKKLTLVERVTSDLFVSINDIVAIGPDSFYVTNDHGFKHPALQFLEDLFGLCLGNVVYYSKSSGARTVASGMCYANGINVGHRNLYVSTTMGQSLLIYSMDAQSGNITLKDQRKFQGLLDNIDVQIIDKNTEILRIVAHSSALQFLRHAMDPANKGPWKLFQITVTNDKVNSINQIIESTGDDISGASVAAHYKSHLVIGSVFDDHILLCSERK